MDTPQFYVGNLQYIVLFISKQLYYIVLLRIKRALKHTDLQMFGIKLTLSSLNLPLSSSSTTSRELLSQFSTCSG